MFEPISEDYCWGQPRFDDPAVRQIQRSEGNLAAWRALLWHADGNDGIARALSSVAGSFAVGLTRPDGRTVLAVDRFAACSLSFRELRLSDGRAALAFDAKADALADAGTPIDAQAVFDYLHFHMIPSPRTIFTGVQRVPPAHCVIGDARGGVDVRPYWRAAFAPSPRAPGLESSKATFMRLVERAVANAADGETALGCFLSGGTDSSTVAGMLTRVTGRPADAYSIGFEAEGYDEMAYARIAAKHFGLRHHEYYVTPDDLVRDIPKLAAAAEQPFGNSSLLPTHLCALRAHGDGVRRLLAGDGGDELFGGNTRYARQRVFGWYERVPAALRSGLLEPVLSQPLASRMPLVRKAASYVEQARVPMPERMDTYNLLRRLGMDEVLEPTFLERIDRSAPLSLQRAVWDDAVADDELNRQLAFDWRFTLGENDLPKVRLGTSTAGVDVAYPMIDRSLVDFSLSLPTRYKVRGLMLRWFFKESLRGFLPDEILRKSKHGFGLPFGPWALRHEGLHRLAVESLDGVAKRGVVRPAFVAELLGRRLAEHPGYYGEMVWILMMLEQWLRHHRPQWRLEAD